MAAALAAIAIIGATGPSGAGEVRVMPDRPDLADSPDAVPSGSAQLESGVTFLRDASGDRPLRQFAAESLLRLGLFENLEARIGSILFARERSEGQGTSGLGDTTLGAKWHLVDEEGWRPALGVLPFVKLPTASRGKGLGSGRADFGGVLLAGKDLPGDLHVDLNLGLAALSLAEAPRGLFLQKVAAVSFSWAVTDRITPFWEIFYKSRDRPTGQHSVGTDFGVSFLLHPRVMVDVSSEFRVAGANPDWAIRGGLSLLLGSLAAGGAPPSGRGSPAPHASGKASVDSAGVGHVAFPPAGSSRVGAWP